MELKINKIPHSAREGISGSLADGKSFPWPWVRGGILWN